MAKKEKHRKIRRKFRCDCGLRRRSLPNMNRHVAARGHKLLNPPVKPVTVATVKRKKG